MQEIKRDNEAKGTRSCKIALYRTFLQCGVRTWGQVITALENCGYEEIAEKVKVQLQVGPQLKLGVDNGASVVVKDGMYCYS